MAKIIEQKQKEFKILGKTYKTFQVNFAQRIWAVKFAEKFNRFCREKTDESKVRLYDLITNDGNLNSLVGNTTDTAEIASKLSGKMTGKLLAASINFQEDLDAAKLEFFLDRDNVTELLSNYLVDCEIDLDSIQDIEAFAKDIEGVYDDFLARYGKHQKFAIA